MNRFFLTMLLSVGCVAVSPKKTEEARTRLSTEWQRVRTGQGSTEQTQVEQALIEQAEQALMRAERLERDGKMEAAQDAITEARLYTQAASHRREVREADAARAELERTRTEQLRHDSEAVRRGSTEEEARRLEEARALVARELREAEEVARADEARPNRASRFGMRTERERQETAARIQTRARVIFFCAQALYGKGSNTDIDGLRSMLLEQLSKPCDVNAALKQLDDARRMLALVRLTQLRALHPTPSREETATLLAELESEGWRYESNERGLVIHVGDGLLPAAKRDRLISILLSHPHGPVILEGKHQKVESFKALAALRLQEGRVLSDRALTQTSQQELIVILPSYAAR